MPAIILSLIAGYFMVIAGCSTSPPKNIKDGCAIFNEKDDWYEESYASFKKWGVRAARCDVFDHDGTGGGAVALPEFATVDAVTCAEEDDVTPGSQIRNI